MQILPGFCCSDVAASDINGDGNLDVLYVDGGEIWTWLGDGKGAFGLVRSQAVPTGRTPIVADFNHDGKLDVALASQNGGVSVSLGNDNGSFQPAIIFPIGGGGIANALVTGDFNGDGNPDLAATNIGLDLQGSTVSILLGNGNGTFGPPVDYPVGGAQPGGVVAADLNGDGKLDLAVANYESFSISVLLGNGDGTFGTKTDYSTGPFPFIIEAADFDNDGSWDLAVSGSFPSLSIFPGNGDGTFGKRQDFAAVTFPSGLAIGDLNVDKKQDVVFTYQAGGLSVFANTTTLVDTTPPEITVSARPTVLWPPNARMVPIVLTGIISDTGSGVDTESAKFVVLDEYGTVQPSGNISISNDGSYSFQIALQALRRGNDNDGRTYTVTVSANDKAGNFGSAQTVITVPHDRAH